MNNLPFTKIRETEEKTEANIGNAKKEAKKRFESAHREAEEIRDLSMEEAKKIAATESEKLESIQKQTDSTITQMKQNFKNRLDDALKLVIQRVME